MTNIRRTLSMIAAGMLLAVWTSAAQADPQSTYVLEAMEEAGLVCQPPTESGTPGLVSTDVLRSYSEPMVAHITNGDGVDRVVAAYIDIDFGSPQSNVHVAVSGDGGQTWPLIPKNLGVFPDVENYMLSSDPVLAVDADGDFWVGALHLNYKACNESNLFLVRRSSDGITWHPGRVIIEDATVLHDRPWLSASPTMSGHLWAGWNSFLPINFEGRCASNGNPYVTYSANNGDTWTTPVPIQASTTHDVTHPPLNYAVARNADWALAAYVGTWDDELGFLVPTVRVVRIAAPETPGELPVVTEIARLDDAKPSAVEHDSLPGVSEALRINSMPITHVAPDDQHALVAWMDKGFVNVNGGLLRQITVSATPNMLWFSPKMRPYPTDRDQFMPMAHWHTSTDVGLCMYERVTPASLQLRVVCGESNDGGVTWGPFTALNPTFTAEGPGTGAIKNFIGDYAWWDGEYLAFGSIKPPAPDNQNYPRPYIEVQRYTGPSSCAIVSPDDATGWWLTLPVAALLLIRQRRIVGLAALLATLAVPVAAYPPNGCFGDCNQDARVTVDELVSGIHDALGVETLCKEALDCNRVGGVVNCLIFAVDNAMRGCPHTQPTPTVTP